jgi:hypothetical protein
LTVQEVNEEGARNAVHGKNPSVVTMKLRKSQMDRFKSFFRDPAKKKTIMKQADLGPESGDEWKAHAVVLIRAAPDCLTLLNSWGDDWGDDGCFRIENPAVFGMTFVSVAGDEQRLSPDDMDFMREERARLVDSPEARAILHGEEIECPECQKVAAAGDYTGSCLRVTCPHCNHSFPPRIESLIRLRYQH